MPAIVERDDPPAVFRQRFDPLREKPVDRVTGGEAMNEQNGFAALDADSRLVDEGEPGALSEKLEHDALLLSRSHARPRQRGWGKAEPRFPLPVQQVLKQIAALTAARARK